LNEDLMAVLEDLQAQTDFAGVNRVAQSTFQSYGFDHFIISGLPEPGLRIEDLMLLSGWKSQWYDRYASGGYIQHDPVARHCFATSIPFDWSAAPYDIEFDLPARRIMQEARDFGMEEGLCIPVHLEAGALGAVSLVGQTRHLSATDRMELHMVALYAYGRLTFLASQSKRPQRRAITPREAEMLKWVAMGKTASEIADITGLSTRTVNQHCENAQRRMGTANRMQTVVEALRHRLITL
jgi:LuxR family quorum sensing-dependent transcriptional regulator